MRKAIGYAPAGEWPAAEQVATTTLDFDARHRRRKLVMDDAGRDFLLDLPAAVAMAEGGGLWLEQGGWIGVRAADEPVSDIACADPVALARIAWHLGNRHLPVEIRPAALRIRRDHVIADMVRGLGAEIVDVSAPFQPEGGAYGGHGHGHNHEH